MPSVRLERAAEDRPAGTGSQASSAHGESASAGVWGRVLAIALLLICLYAAFAHGAVSSPVEERVQLALALIGLLAAVGWQWRGGLALRAPGIVWAAVALLTSFAFWSGMTVLWSVAPDRTWTECNRVITYCLVLVLALAVGASLRRAVALVAGGLLLVCLAVAAYALGQKLVPGLHLAGVFTLNQTALLPRLQEPLGYWNALALLLAMGIPGALVILVDRDRPDGLRLAAATAIVTMLLTIGFTYSRGAVLALVLAVALTVALSGAWLRCLMWLAAVLIATTPVMLVGLNSYRLTALGVGLSARERAGGELIVVLGACLLLLVVGGRGLIRRERNTTVSPAAVRTIVQGLIAAAVLAVAVAVIGVAVSSRGLGGTASHAWSSFTATRTISVNDPSRLLSADSENRWVWWKEAAGAFSDRPLQGWGAGSFGVVHLLYRRDTLSVQQPHSLPLQFLAETGLVGATLGLGALLLLLAAGLRAVRRFPLSRTRLPAISLLAAAAAYAVHSLFDWDWDIPAVTIPALLALGVLGGTLVAPVRPSARRLPAARRAGSLALSAICLAAFAASVAMPRIAAADAGHALLLAASGRPGSLASGLHQARLSSRIDPLSDAGLLAAATIQLHRGDPATARADLISAVRREPSDEQAWQELSYTDFTLRNYVESVVAAQHALTLDPEGQSALSDAQRAALSLAAPAGSATATVTPRSVP